MTDLESKIKELNYLNKQVDERIDAINDLIENKNAVYVRVQNNNKCICEKFTLADNFLYFEKSDRLVLEIKNREPFIGSSKIHLWLKNYKLDWSFSKKDLTITFKKGDRVRLINYGVERDGTVISSNTVYTHVQLDDIDHEMLFRTGELRLVKGVK